MYLATHQWAHFWFRNWFSNLFFSFASQGTALMETGFTHDFSCKGNATRQAKVHLRPPVCPLCTRHIGKLCSGLHAPNPTPLSTSEAHSFLKMALKAQVPTGAVSEHSPYSAVLRPSRNKNHLILMCLEKHSPRPRKPLLSLVADTHHWLVLVLNN